MASFDDGSRMMTTRCDHLMTKFCPLKYQQRDKIDMEILEKAENTWRYKDVNR